MILRVVAVSSLLVAFTGWKAPAIADRPGSARVQVNFEGSLKLRASGLTVGTRSPPVANSVGAGLQPKKAKEEMSLARSPIVAKRAPRAQRPLNEYEQAVADLKRQAALVDPSFVGRGEISFVVGKNGEALRAVVFGLSPGLNLALTKHLATAHFPKEHAGQYYATKLTLRPPLVAKPPETAKPVRASAAPSPRRRVRR